MKRIILFSPLILIFSFPAFAWIPPSHFIIKSMAKKHAPLDEAKFVSKILVYDKNGEIKKAFSETLAFTSSDHVTARLSNESNALISSTTRNLSINKSSEGTRPVLYDLLFIKNQETLFNRFKELGLPLKTETEIYSEREGNLPYKPETGTVGFGRFENKYGVVISENVSKPALERHGPQLWVEKNSYLPIRAIFEGVEYVFDQYRSEGGFLYPGIILVRRNGYLWVKIENRSSKLGVGSSKVPTAKPSSDVDSNDRDFAQEYFKWVR